MRKYPTNAGIDMAGTVESSTDPRWKHGDKVIVHGYDMGVAHDGGYSEYVRVPADWVVRRPESMTAFDAMTLGTAGFTAAQAIMLMEHNGLKPDNGPVAVTGATGGVARSRSRSWPRPATTWSRSPARKRRPTTSRRSARRRCSQRQSIDLAKIRPLDKATWAGAVDNLGGDMLAWLLSTMKIGGTVGAVGLAADMKLNTTVAPFILRGVRLLGADSVNCPMSLRQKIWNKLAVEWRPDRSTTRCARSTSTSCRRTSTPTSRAWSAAAPSSGSPPTADPGRYRAPAARCRRGRRRAVTRA